MGEGVKENGGRDELRYDRCTNIYCRNSCKRHNVPPPYTIIKKL
jgi:hypothetical protein